MPPRKKPQPAARAGPAIDVTLEAKIIVVCGGSGSGKSAKLKQDIRGDQRIVAWDVDGEYGELPGWRTVTNGAELARTLSRLQKGKIAFSPPGLTAANFNHWAKCAYAWGNCTAVAEETADVTSPGKAPDGWGQLVRKGRKRGITIYAVTQRPSESDKTVMGNRTLIRVHRMERDADRRYIAREIGEQYLPLLNALVSLDYVEKSAKSDQVFRGRVRF